MEAISQRMPGVTEKITENSLGSQYPGRDSKSGAFREYLELYVSVRMDFSFGVEDVRVFNSQHWKRVNTETLKLF
jgi:hypothetical protein